MSIIDDRTPNLDLPLPNKDNLQTDDVARVRTAFLALDTIVQSKAPASALASKADLVDGKVPSGQLPSFVDDVIEFTNLAGFPTVGETSKIYIAINDGDSPSNPSKQYRWSGSAYVLIPASPGTTDSVPEGATNKYFTDVRARAAQVPTSTLTPGLMKVGSGLISDPDGTVHVVSGGGGGTGLPAYTDSYVTPSTNGQTIFTVTGGYQPGQIDVILNGVMLFGGGDDYTASNGTSFTLTTGVLTTDLLLVRRWAYLPDANALNKMGDTMTGALNWAAPVSAASAATVNIGVLASNNVTITGTTDISSLGTYAAGAVRRVTFSNSLVLVHNATSLILPGAINITTIAGDVAEFVSLGGSNWRCTGYLRSRGDTAVLYSPELHTMFNL